MADRSSGITLPSGKMPKAFSAADTTSLGGGGGAGGGLVDSNPYRYWRLLMTAAIGSGYVELSRFNLMDKDGAYIHAQMTSDSGPSPLVASASEAVFGTSAYMCFDRSASTRVHTNTPSSAEWFQIDLGSGNDAGIAIVGLSFSNATTRYIPQFKVQGSATAAWAGEEEDVMDSSPWGLMTADTWKANGQIRYFVVGVDYSVMKT
jgi:hypothetical protein